MRTTVNFPNFAGWMSKYLSLFFSVIIKTIIFMYKKKTFENVYNNLRAVSMLMKFHSTQPNEFDFGASKFVWRQKIEFHYFQQVPGPMSVPETNGNSFQIVQKDFKFN